MKKQSFLIECLEAAAKLQARIDKAKKKFEATHELVGVIVPHNGRYKPGTEKALFPAFRMTAEGKREMVRLNHYRYKGWDHGKKYTVAKLQELAKERKLAREAA